MRFLEAISKPRIAFVQQVEDVYKLIPRRTIFLATGDTLPFQTEPGQLMMIVLSNQHDYSNFYKKEFLWNVGNLYQEHDGVGFGFFTSESKLKEFYDKYHLTPTSVRAFTWDNTKIQLTDITKIVKQQI